MKNQQNAAKQAVQAELCHKDVIDARDYAEGKVIEARTVAFKKAEDGGTDAEWGAARLIDWLDDQFEKASFSTEPVDQVLASLARHIDSVIAIVELVNKDEDSILFHAAETILMVAKNAVDAAVKAIPKDRHPGVFRLAGGAA